MGESPKIHFFTRSVDVYVEMKVREMTPNLFGTIITNKTISKNVMKSIKEILSDRNKERIRITLKEKRDFFVNQLSYMECHRTTKKLNESSCLEKENILEATISFHKELPSRLIMG